MGIPAMNLTFSCCCYLGFLGVLTSHQVLSLMALRRVTHLTNLTLSVIRLSLQRKFAWIISEVKACCTIPYIFTQWSSCMYNWQHKHNRFSVLHWHLCVTLTFEQLYCSATHKDVHVFSAALHSLLLKCLESFWGQTEVNWSMQSHLHNCSK